MRIDVLTLFPEMFPAILSSSILKRAATPRPLPHAPQPDTQTEHFASAPSSPDTPDTPDTPVATGAPGPPTPPVSYHITNIRDYTTDKHQKADQRPFGGGPGMVLQCQPIWDAVIAVEKQDPRPATRVLMSPQGRTLDQPLVEQLAQRPRLLIIAGHYEGIDQRVIQKLHPLTEISIGDYVLTGGELPALVLIDAVVRLLPGVLGHDESAIHESFSPGSDRLLDHPHYTRPRVWQGLEVPPVLLSGDHAQIEDWRRRQALETTAQRRPDLLKKTSKFPPQDLE